MEIGKPDKKLKVYKENEQYIIELGNDLHSLKKEFATESEMLKALDAYRYIMNECDVEVEKELFGRVVKHLNN